MKQYTFLILLLFTTNNVYGHNHDRYDEQVITKKNHSGITLNILSHEKPVIGQPTAIHAAKFEQLTGIKIKVKYVPFSQLYQEARWGLKQQKYDIVFFGSIWSADLYHYLAPIPKEFLSSKSYTDLIPHYRLMTQWGDTSYQVSVDGDRHFLQYRTDFFNDPNYKKAFKQQFNTELSIPKTWPELNRIAQFFQGKQSKTGEDVYGLAEITNQNDLLFFQYIKRAAPYAKHPDIKDGFYFDLTTMKAQINTPGFVAALDDFTRSAQSYPPNGDNFTLNDVIDSFGKGQTIFSDSWDDSFIKAMQPDSGISNKVAAVQSPGSKKVWNRKTAKWDNFPDVNYVPYFSLGWTTGVNEKSKNKQAAFDFLGFYTNSQNHQADLVKGSYGINPNRFSDLKSQFWVDNAGWNQKVADSYTTMLKNMAQSNNWLSDLRIHQSKQYMNILAAGVHRALSGQTTAQKALDDVALRWDRLTQSVGIEKQRQAYSKVLQIENGHFLTQQK